ncbi:tetratricopeptide repeat protein [Kitasatospora sp. NPDC088783]|uniref:tetratricopeptide repeat protein n=1 Tax=Kitasatospora sp. NPDC088783 TaxID=3364077 RepID=UPI00380095EC
MDFPERLEDARQALVRAVESGDLLASANLGRVLALLGDHTESVRYLSRSLDSGNMEILPELGTQLAACGDFAKAEERFLEGVRKGVDGAHSAYADFLNGQGEGRVLEAERQYRMAHAGGEYAASWNLAIFLSAKGSYGEAVRYYEDSLKEGFEDAELNLAVALEKTGDASGAEAHYRRAIELHDPLAGYNFTSFLLGSGRIGDAMRLREEIAEYARPEELAAVDGMILKFSGA